MELGTMAEWVTAVVALLGFGATIWQLRVHINDSRVSREQAKRDEQEFRQAMARAVGLKSSWQTTQDGGPPSGEGTRMPVNIEIMNAGPYPIRNVVLQLATDDIPAEIVLGSMLPNEHIKDTFEVHRSDVVFGEITGGATLLFTDAFDNHWSLSTSWEGLERLENPARNC